jgi:hypothetical protein
MQEDITCICGKKFEPGYIDQHRKFCSVYQTDKEVWDKFKLSLDSFEIIGKDVPLPVTNLSSGSGAW